MARDRREEDAAMGADSLTLPSAVVVHLRGHTVASPGPGLIQVVDATTGQVLKTLGRVSDPYPGNGFVVDWPRQTLFYCRLNEPAQRIEIVAAPLGGEYPAVIGEGDGLRVSPDGRFLAYVTLGWLHAPMPRGPTPTVVVVTLVSGERFRSSVPSSSPAEHVFSTAWMPTSMRLAAITGIPPPRQRGPLPRPGHPRPPPAPRPPPPLRRLFILDVTESSGWTELPFPETWADRRWELCRAGAEAGTLVASEFAPTSPVPRHSVASIRPETGEIVNEIVVPERTQLLATEPATTLFVLAAGRDQGTVVWDAGSARSTHIAASATQATW